MNLLQYLFVYSAKLVGMSYLLMSFCTTTWNLSVFASFPSSLFLLSEEVVSLLLVVESSEEDSDVFSFYAYYLSLNSYLILDLVTQPYFSFFSSFWMSSPSRFFHIFHSDAKVQFLFSHPWESACVNSKVEVAFVLVSINLNKVICLI